MRYISVSYLVDDDEYERLIQIAEGYKQQGLDLTPEKIFESIMTCGAKYDKDNKLKFHEWKLGLREDYK